MIKLSRLVCLALLLCACGKEPVRAHITNFAVVTSAVEKPWHIVCTLRVGTPVDVLDKTSTQFRSATIYYYEIQDPLDEKCRGWVGDYFIRFD